MKTVHDIDTDIALARKEITDMNIAQYAVPEKIKGIWNGLWITEPRRKYWSYCI